MCFLIKFWSKNDDIIFLRQFRRFYANFLFRNMKNIHKNVDFGLDSKTKDKITFLFKWVLYPFSWLKFSRTINPKIRYQWIKKDRNFYIQIYTRNYVIVLVLKQTLVSKWLIYSADLLKTSSFFKLFKHLKKIFCKKTKLSILST